jgi:hypothetical protein
VQTVGTVSQAVTEARRDVQALGKREREQTRTSGLLLAQNESIAVTGGLLPLLDDQRQLISPLRGVHIQRSDLRLCTFSRLLIGAVGRFLVDHFLEIGDATGLSVAFEFALRQLLAL